MYLILFILPAWHGLRIVQSVQYGLWHRSDMDRDNHNKWKQSSEKNKKDTHKAKLTNQKLRPLTNKNSFGAFRTDTIFALFKAPPMQGNMHNVYLNTYIQYRKGNT